MINKDCDDIVDVIHATLEDHDEYVCVCVCTKIIRTLSMLYMQLCVCADVNN